MFFNDQIWQIADTENRGLLTPAGFGLVLRLIGYAQSGKQVSPELALKRIDSKKSWHECSKADPSRSWRSLAQIRRYTPAIRTTSKHCSGAAATSDQWPDQSSASDPRQGGTILLVIRGFRSARWNPSWYVINNAHSCMADPG